MQTRQTATVSTGSSASTRPPIDGATHVTPEAVRGAIEAAFSTHGDPPVRTVHVSRQGGGWRARIVLVAAEATPLERSRWVTDEFLPRWTTLEHQLHSRLYLRREWV